MSSLAAIGLVVALYLALTLAIGLVAARRNLGTPEDYFLGGRAARSFVLFMALFGTNVTPFVLLGIPGQSYHLGVGVFGLNAAIVGFGIPLTFYLIGEPARRAARRLGALTPAELYAERLASPAVGLALFAAFFVYTLPYMVTAVIGAGLTTEVLTQGTLSFETSSALILAVTIAYTALGGMRATMWTNVLQGATFLGFITAAFFLIAARLGGPTEASAAVLRAAPALLEKQVQGPFAPGPYLSWGLAISLTVIAFPHMLVRVFAARDAAALKNVCRFYPPVLVALWLPAVMFGVWGAAEFPGLAGKASDAIFPLLVERHLGPVLQGMALAGVLAAVMSTLDAQLLTLSSMLTRDVARRVRPGLAPAREVLVGRAFTLLLALAVFALVLRRPASIFDIAAFSFSGYVTLTPLLLLGVRWRRFTAVGALASLALGNLALALALAGVLPAPFGVLPVAWGLLGAIVGALAGSALSRPPPQELVARALGPLK